MNLYFRNDDGYKCGIFWDKDNILKFRTNDPYSENNEFPIINNHIIGYMPLLEEKNTIIKFTQNFIINNFEYNNFEYKQYFYETYPYKCNTKFTEEIKIPHSAVSRKKNKEANLISGYSYLTNNFCPICLEQKQIFEKHHCIPKAFGGTDNYFNILKICTICHMRTIKGDPIEQGIVIHAIIFHNFYHYGSLFFSKFNFNKISEDEMKKEFPLWYYNYKYPHNTKKIKELAKAYYLFYRNLILKKINLDVFLGIKKYMNEEENK